MKASLVAAVAYLIASMFSLISFYRGNGFMWGIIAILMFAAGIKNTLEYKNISKK